jgi:hypothetical protein
MRHDSLTRFALVIGSSAALGAAGLTPPSDQRATYRRYLAGGARQIALLGETSAAIRAGDTKHAAVLSRQLTAEVKRVDATASALGLKQCARS